jgi:DnaJ-class molecular chaperone
MAREDNEEEQGESGGPEGASHGPAECMPCRGTGKVISRLGGEESTVTCPWCEGTGERVSGVDAQTS